jgi:hypothetical protein
MSKEKTRRDDGRYEPEFSDGDFLKAVADVDVAATSNVASAVGCKRITAYKRLRRLCENGKVSKTEAGGTFIWKLTERGGVDE